MMPPFHVLGLGDPLRGNCFRMTQNFVTDLILIQTINQPFGYIHAILRTKISLSRSNSTFRNGSLFPFCGTAEDKLSVCAPNGFLACLLLAD
jgi:hypothetical protein